MSNPVFPAADQADELIFSGEAGSGISCEDFIRRVRQHAFDASKPNDHMYMANYALTRISGDAVHFLESLPDETLEDWKLLRRALLSKYGASSASANPSTSDRSRNITSNSLVPTPAAASPPPATQVPAPKPKSTIQGASLATFVRTATFLPAEFEPPVLRGFIELVVDGQVTSFGYRPGTVCLGLLSAEQFSVSGFYIHPGVRGIFFQFEDKYRIFDGSRSLGLRSPWPSSGSADYSTLLAPLVDAYESSPQILLWEIKEEGELIPMLVTCTLPKTSGFVAGMTYRSQEVLYDIRLVSDPMVHLQSDANRHWKKATLRFRSQ